MWENPITFHTKIHSNYFYMWITKVSIIEKKAQRSVQMTPVMSVPTWRETLRNENTQKLQPIKRSTTVKKRRDSWNRHCRFWVFSHSCLLKKKLFSARNTNRVDIYGRGQSAIWQGFPFSVPLPNSEISELHNPEITLGGTPKLQYFAYFLCSLTARLNSVKYSMKVRLKL